MTSDQIQAVVDAILRFVQRMSEWAAAMSAAIVEVIRIVNDTAKLLPNIQTMPE